MCIPPSVSCSADKTVRIWRAYKPGNQEGHFDFKLFKYRSFFVYRDPHA